MKCRSDLLYADKLCHCNCVAGTAGNMSAEHRKTHLLLTPEF